MREATIDDGSCIGDGVAVTISVTTDTWPGETTWTLSDSIGEVVLSGGPYTTNGITDEQLICVGDGCYTFSIADSFGDGIFDPGGYTLTVDGNLIASGGDFDFGETTEFCTDNLNFAPTRRPATTIRMRASTTEARNFDCLGCTLPSACNYDEEATQDDGSCLFDDDCGVCGGDNSTCGCTNPDARNYNPDATIDDGSCVLDGVNYTMTSVLDQYPGEFTWILTDATGNTVWSGGPYDEPDATVVETACLPKAATTSRSATPSVTASAVSTAMAATPSRSTVWWWPRAATSEMGRPSTPARVATSRLHRPGCLQLQRIRHGGRRVLHLPLRTTSTATGTASMMPTTTASVTRTKWQRAALSNWDTTWSARTP